KRKSKPKWIRFNGDIDIDGIGFTDFCRWHSQELARLCKIPVPPAEYWLILQPSELLRIDQPAELFGDCHYAQSRLPKGLGCTGHCHRQIGFEYGGHNCSSRETDILHRFGEEFNWLQRLSTQLR